MAEEKKERNVDDLLKQISEFEKTIQGLQENVTSLKARLVQNKEKYGTDINQWPKEN